MSIRREQAFQLGIQLKRVGLYEASWDAFERAQQTIQAEGQGMDVEAYVDVLLEQGELGLKLGWLDRSKQKLNLALSFIESSTKVNVPLRARILFGLSCVHHYRREHEKARALLFYVLQMQKEIAPKGSVEMARTVHILAEHYRETGKPEDAQQMYEAAMLMQSSLLGKNHPEYLCTAHDYAHHLAQTGLLEDSAEQLRQVIAQRETTLGAAHPEVLESLRLLAEIYTHQKCFERADETIARAKSLVRGDLALQQELSAMD